ncbi:hypothetical protein CYMTET_56073 [Cymbomonas tetramitiformis]|uniref:Uncharacterized protein n=1 Tax=Cymbomonas tetramitiformis TaxID=36881 RepID=A0AAE0EMX9_9CHLO|nr:hypothetical protein CYMTET_56073 [Cymbomonas tetramitiformis]
MIALLMTSLLLSILCFLCLWRSWSTRSATSESPRLKTSPLRKDNCWLEYRTINGRATELLWVFPAHVKGPTTLIVMVPGFPGVSQIYAGFMDDVTSHTGSAAVCISWMGHHVSPQGHGIETENANLQEHVAHQADAMQWLLDTARWDRVVLCAQSLGAWLAVSALSRLDQQQSAGMRTTLIQEVQLFCPVMEHMADVERARQLGWALRLVWRLRAAYILGAVVRCFGVKRVGEGIYYIQSLRGKTDHSDVAHAGWLWESLARHMPLEVFPKAIDAAVEGLSLIGAFTEDMKETLEARQVDIHYAKDDGWTPVHMQRKWRTDFPSAAVWTHNIRHALVTNPARAKEVAKVAAQRMIETSSRGLCVRMNN